jgi:hypothetical protein
MFVKEYWAVVVSGDVIELTVQRYIAANIAKDHNTTPIRVEIRELAVDNKPRLVKVDAKSEQNLRPTGNGQDNEAPEDR